jgi:hypothetical protein
VGLTQHRRTVPLARAAEDCPTGRGYHPGTLPRDAEQVLRGGHGVKFVVTRSGAHSRSQHTCTDGLRLAWIDSLTGIRVHFADSRAMPSSTWQVSTVGAGGGRAKSPHAQASRATRSPGNAYPMPIEEAAIDPEKIANWFVLFRPKQPFGKTSVEGQTVHTSCSSDPATILKVSGQARVFCRVDSSRGTLSCQRPHPSPAVGRSFFSSMPTAAAPH